MQPKILVTGANGFTGNYFCRYLAEQGIPVRGMYYGPDGAPGWVHPNVDWCEGDLLDRASLQRALSGIEVVQNIAALYRPTTVPESAYQAVNVDGIRNMVEEAARAGVKRFVQCSTVGVHGSITKPPADENAPIAPDDYYQRTKYEGEVLSLELGPKLGLPISVVRPAAIYGPFERRFLKLAKALNTGKFVMFGDAERVSYHFVHVRDLCDGMMLAAEAESAVGEAFILGDERALTLRETFEIISHALGRKPPRLALPYGLLYGVSAAVEAACKPFRIAPPLYRRRAAWFNSTRSFTIAKAKSMLGYQPRVRPEDGLREMVASFAQAGWLG
jgi:nucleoside-diphosphate-sugar epimerase